jgi:N-hydroxyarylamine O-acetyltransferase
MNVDIPAYLQRIGYHGPTAPTVEVLCALHRAHMMSVPFENLDIGIHRTIFCEETSFVRKVVEGRRGGFCYELNGAFAALVRELGFKVTLLSARVARADGGVSPEFDHLALLVDLDEPYLADVGFGDSFNEPLRLQSDVEQLQDGRRFRITRRANEFQMAMANPGEDYRAQYQFSLIPRQLSEFAPMCHFHQTSPESHFTQNRICSMATEDGRVTLSEMRLITRKNWKKSEEVLQSDEQWRNALKQHFGVVLPR